MSDSQGRVLVAEDEQVCSLVVQRLLAKAGFEVTVVRDGKAALLALEKASFSAVLVDWMLPEIDGIEVVRRVAAMPSPKPRAILTSVIDIPAAREYAIAAGAIEFLPKPIAPAKLLEVLRTQCAAATVDVVEAAHPLARSRAWAELGNRSVKPLSDLLGGAIDAESTTVTTNPNDEVRVLAATLVDPSRNCEVYCAVLASPSATLAVGKQMLGDETTEDEAEDALSEVVNVVAGVVKAAFVADGFNFTLSLPGKFPASEFIARQRNSLASVCVSLRLGDAKLALSFLVASTSEISILAEELHEGFVLAEDLRRNGALLLPACTRLTESAARRVRETCKGIRIKVCPPMRA